MKKNAAIKTAKDQHALDPDGQKAKARNVSASQQDPGKDGAENK